MAMGAKLRAGKGLMVAGLLVAGLGGCALDDGRGRAFPVFFEAWSASQAFARGHAQASGRPAGDGPAATGSTIWSFEVVQATDPA